MTDWMAGWRRADNQREKEEGCKKNENSIIANLLMSPSHAYLSLSLKKFGVGVPGRRNKLPEIQLNTYSTTTCPNEPVMRLRSSFSEVQSVDKIVRKS